MKEYETNVSMVSPQEGEDSQKLCEIRFDCFVTMYEMGARKSNDRNIFIKTENKPIPQWFKSQGKITLEAIRYSDEYSLGRILKDMLYQMDAHIRKFENRVL